MLKEQKLHNQRRILTHDEFRRKVLNNKERIYNEIINRIPAVKMKLKYLRNEGTVEFKAEINSVFDICWYTLGRMIAVNAPKQDEDLESYTKRYYEGTMGLCPICGCFFIKKVIDKSIVV